MNPKINNVDYNQLAAKFISDAKLSLMIQQNISFVEKYIDIVEDTFESDVERQVVYRELGSIVYSCIEALLKSVLVEINRRCKNSHCQEKKCKYRNFSNNDKINYAHVINALEFLLSTRLIALTPTQIDELKRLNDLRNYVHISKIIGDGSGDVSFEKEYVEKMLFYYYEFLDQLDVCDFYFEDDQACLKILDNDGMDFTELQIRNGNKTYYLLRMFSIVPKLLSNEALSDDDSWTLKMLNDAKNVDEDGLSEYIKKELFYARRYFDSEKDYRTAKEAFRKRICHLLKNVNRLHLELENFDKE